MFAYEQLLLHKVKHSKILCFLDFLPFLLHKFTTSLKICRSIVIRSGWQHVSRTELGSSSCELPAWAWAWAGTVEVSVNRQSLKYPIKITFTFSFLFPFQRKRKVTPGILTVCKKKANCVGFGIELRHKNNIHVGLCNLVTIKKGCRWARRMISLLRSEMNFTKNNHFVLVVDPQVFVRFCNLLWEYWDSCMG